MRLNNKGITLVESLIAVLLAGVAIVSLMPMQDMALRTASKSDNMGRAHGVLQAELEFQEQRIMKTLLNTDIAAGSTTKTVPASGVTGIAGDANFTVVTTISLKPTLTNAWYVHVKVTWPGNATGIENRMIVTQQMGFQ